MRDHYTILQVSRGAEPEVIEKAYKALSMKYHPDRVEPSSRESATRRMQRINEAYAVLCDPSARSRYDASLPGTSAGSGWELFMDKGLVGLFMAWYHARIP